MNIYNLQEFRCASCQNWFHPRHAQPYLLACGHSVCRRCISSASSISIYCPHHQSHTLVSKIVLNSQIQKALERLMKSTSEITQKPRKPSPMSLVQKLQQLVKQKEEDMVAFAQLLERVYSNEINRIIHLRNRVRQQVIGHAEAVKYWKILIQNSKNPLQLIEEGQNIEKRIIQFNELKLEEMAEQVIAKPAAVLLPHFTITDLCKIRRKNTLKLSAKKPNEVYQSDTRFMSSKFKNQSDNQASYMIRTVESPDKSRLYEIKDYNNHCKQLSSFKLDSSLKKSIPQGRLKNSKFVQQFRLSNSLFEGDQNGQITLRQNQHSKCSLKTKAEKREQNRSHFAELINSLKMSDQLQYSSQKSQQLLLSSSKPEINFLQECPIEKKHSKGGLEVRQREIINCEHENNKYIKRMQGAKTEQAQMSTSVANNTLQLFNFDLKQVDMKAYLQKFDWTALQTVKLVGTGMQDAQFNILLNFLINSKIHTLILPNNELQQISLDALVNFTSVNKKLRTISLQRNNIHPLQGNTRTKIVMLKKRGLTLYI